MTNGIGFALLSLVFAGVNDVVFKRYSRKDRSRGMYVFGIGLVWGMLQVASMAVTETPIALDAATIRFGLFAGVLLTLSNILLLESFTHIPVSLGSTIYRLNTVGVAVLAFFLLAEPLGGMKLAGIGLGILAVLLLYHSGTDVKLDSPRGLVPFFLMAVAASGLRAGYGVTIKGGILASADPQTMLLVCALSWVLGGAAYACLREGRFRFTRKKGAYAALSGLLVFLIVDFLMLAVKYDQASTVIPIANMSFVTAILISTGTRLERLTWRKVAAILLAGASIFALAQA